MGDSGPMTKDPAVADTVESPPVATPTDGMIITESTVLRPGVYALPNGITIAGDNIVVDGGNATLVGSGREGAGITINGRADVTIRNFRIREYRHGIAASGCRGLNISDNQISATAEIEANTVFLNIWEPVERAYGGAILLNRVTDSEICENDLQHQMVGLAAYACDKLHVQGNNASYNSGFGFLLFATSDCVYEDNYADYCCRWEPRTHPGPSTGKPEPRLGAGAYGHMGADATGFLLVNCSCRNVFRRNCARLGGDGFFLAGRSSNGANAGCDDNIFEENDASLSPNIAFEATFCSGNIFRNNWADRCNYGFWLGFSRGNVLRGNRMLWNRQAGIAVENGVDFEVRENNFQSNGHGVLIWSKFVEAFADAEPANVTSRDWHIEKNRFYRNGTAIAIFADKDHGIRPMPAEFSGRAELRPQNHLIVDNDVQDNRVGIHIQKADGTVIRRNRISKNVEADIRLEDDRDTQVGHNLGAAGAYL